MADLKVKVGLDRSGFTTGLASMENSVKGFGTKVGGILAGAFAFDSIISGFTNAIAVGDRLQDLANRFGLSASSLQEIGNAASLAGGSLEDVASAMNKLAKNAGEALGNSGGEIAQAFARIGVSAEDLKSMNPQELFMALSKAVASGTLGLEAFAVAQKLAGRGAASLMETLAMGPAAITANGQAMGVFSDETIAALSEAQDAITTLQNQFTIAFGIMASAIMPVVEGLKAVIEFYTLAAASAVAFLSGDKNAAKAIFDRAAKLGIEKGAERERKAAVKKVATGGMGDERSDPPLIDKAAETSKNKLKAAEDRLADAVRDRESLSMGNSEKLARAQAELIALKIEEFNIADKTLEKVKAQEEIERKKIEVIGLQNDIKEEVRTADKDFLRASKSGDLEGMQEANERGKRLERESKKIEVLGLQNDEDLIKTNLNNFKQAEQEKMALLKERIGLLPDLEELQAERAGPDAERQLLRKRAQEAGDQARKTGNIEDVTRAQQAALAFQRAKESQLRSQGFGDAATASARAQASQVVGPLPGAAELGQALAASKASADELAKAQNAGTKQQEKLTVVLDRMQQMANKAGGLSSLMPGPVEESFATTEEASTGALGDLPGIGELFDFKKLLNDLSKPASPKNLPIELANPPDLKPIMDKLDQLIKNAGVFS